MQSRSDGTVIIGIDIGSWTFKVSVFRQKCFEILTNQANFRETPSLVSFAQSSRHIGEQAENKIKSNYMNTIRSPLRLIGIEKCYDLVEQELKYTTVKYDMGEELHFIVQVDKGKSRRIQPEHLLVSLLGKVYRIAESHGLYPSSYVLSVPSYMSHYERKIVKRCGEIVLHTQEITLIDDWVSLASDYTYNKIIQLKTCEPRIVVLLDIGYAKCSFFVVEFTKKDFRLLDSEHLRYVGSKNMDHLLAEFYDKKLKTQLNTEQSIFATHKSLVKVIDHIQKQRRILSANEDSHLNIESLMQDVDLSYNMKREQFEKIVGFVLSEIKAGLNKIRERMPATIKPYSVELIGGASRIPSIRTLVQDVFKLEPSRTLNQSQAMARGASVFGAVSAKLWPLFYELKDMNLVDICACWNPTGVNKNFFGQNQRQYTKKEVIFKCNGVVPDENVLSFNDMGPVELYIYYGHVVSTRTIGYVRFNSPNRVKFILDKNKIVNVKLDCGEFLVCKMQDKKEAKWSELRKWESELQLNEERIIKIQLLKNEYEAKFYQLRSRIEHFREFMTAQENISIQHQLAAIEGFIEEENYRTLNSQADLELYNTKLRQIQEYSQPLSILQQRKQARWLLIQKYEQLKQQFERTDRTKMSAEQNRKFRLLLQWTLDSHKKMQESNWQGYYLTPVSLNYAVEELQRILMM